MRNLNALRLETSALANRYGRRNITVHNDGNWVKQSRFPLPKGQYNLETATILIIIPERYNSVSISECYVDADLRFRKGNSRLPHVHAGFQTGYRKVGYEWLCFEPPQGPNEGLIGFIHTLRAYFTDPHAYVQANKQGFFK